MSPPSGKMLPDLSEAELARLDALVDEPQSETADDTDETADGVEPAASVAAGAEPAPEAEQREQFLQRQSARELLSSLDSVLWRLAERSVPIDEASSFHALVETRERALGGAGGGPPGTP